jgi:hypothetical protein
LNQPRPRAWVGRALFVATIVLLVLAVALAAVGVAARVDASHQRSRAEPATRALRTEVASRGRSVGSLVTLRRRADELASALSTLLGAIRAQVDSANHAVSVANHAADLYNSRDGAGATSALDADRQAALDDLGAKTRAVRDAVTTVQQDATAFEEASHG